ncbi:hypothetical protein [Winogradskyella schleiferi]|uniref:hypothetical protein n=1 Tax=Winogradskyella schleiferi TaxID=2686078 RepID=UPI0015B96D21|nr:hypothetical protein [Winogradskyella schleiferi]
MIFTKPRPTPKLIYGVGLVLLGIISIISGQYLGFMFMAISLYFLKRDGIEFNLDKNTYREITSLFGLTIGQWQDFPEIEYISVFKTDQTSRVWVSTASTNVTSTIVKVNLFYNTNRKIEAFVTEDTQKAFDVAKEIATVLNVDVLDATERESKWL